MLLWCRFKAFQRSLHLESGLARGGQKNNISFDLLQNMMVRGGGPKPSGAHLPELPFKTSVSLLRTQCCPRWRRCMAGWLAGWVGGVGWLAGLSGWLVGWVGWLVGWVVGLSGWQGKNFLVSTTTTTTTTTTPTTTTTTTTEQRISSTS